MVSLDIETDDEVTRSHYFERLECLKNLMKSEVSEEIIFSPKYMPSSGKNISRIHLDLTVLNINRQTE